MTERELRTWSGELLRDYAPSHELLKELSERAVEAVRQRDIRKLIDSLVTFNPENVPPPGEPESKIFPVTEYYSMTQVKRISYESGLFYLVTGLLRGEG